MVGNEDSSIGIAGIISGRCTGTPWESDFRDLATRVRDRLLLATMLCCIQDLMHVSSIYTT